MKQSGKWNGAESLSAPPTQLGQVLNRHVSLNQSKALNNYCINTNMNAPPIQIGTSIWFTSTRKRMIIEYHPDSESVGTIIAVPPEFKNAWSMSCCKYKDDSIVIIAHVQYGPFILRKNSIGSNSIYSKHSAMDHLTIFNTKTLTFSNPKQLPKIMGLNASCVAIGDFIHIFHGIRNRDGCHLVYSVNHNKTRCSYDETNDTNRQLFTAKAVVKPNDEHKASNKMLISGFIREHSGKHVPSVIVDIISRFGIFEVFKFGGHQSQSAGSLPPHMISLDSFYIGTLENGDASQPIQWTLAPEYTLKYPLHYFAHVQYGPFILTFGGFASNAFWTDDIYILDLRKKSGWIQSPIKCVGKNCYNAVLVDAERVHLFDRSPQATHYWIDLKEIIPESMYNMNSM